MGMLRIVCMCVSTHMNTGKALLPRLLSQTSPSNDLGSLLHSPLLTIFFAPSQLRPQRNLLIESPTKSSFHQTDTLANTLTESSHFQSKHTQDGGWVCVHICVCSVVWGRKSTRQAAFLFCPCIQTPMNILLFFNDLQIGACADLDFVVAAI